MANQLVIHCQSKLGLLIEDNFYCHSYHLKFKSNALDHRRIQDVLKVTANQNYSCKIRDSFAVSYIERMRGLNFYQTLINRTIYFSLLSILIAYEKPHQGAHQQHFWIRKD